MSAPQQQTRKTMTGNQIRRSFVEFFARNGHRVVPSSSLVPVGDPTLLFTNAGMNQFKDVFLGLEQRDYKRAVTVQKCVRAGGKHNDLENVGFTNRHHTFFEMLGNFSFGDYFKKDAIALAWELVTKEWALPTSKLYFTVFGGADVAPGTKLGADEEARGFWSSQGAPAERVIAIPGLKDNFWAMGDTGPCGPCSEIFYDFGPAASEVGHKDCQFPCECGRYVEIWNLVFMQLNRIGEGEQIHDLDTDGLRYERYRLENLPKPCVDTGAGLERITAVLQGKVSNFETDLFMPLIHKCEELIGFIYGSDFKGDASLKVISDHSRAATFLIANCVIPSNEGRGYVLRKIIRRAIRHARLLDYSKPLLSQLASTVRDEMGSAYPELGEAHDRIVQTLLEEENRFARILSIGWRKLEEEFGRLIEPHATEVKNLEDHPPNEEVKAVARLAHTGSASGIRRMTALLGAAGKTIPFPGDTAFRLSDTFGLPKDFIYESSRDMGFEFDEEGYEQALAAQRARSRASWKGVTKEAARPVYTKLAETFRTELDFYYSAATKDCRIEAIVTKDGQVNEIATGAEAEVVLDRTVFYAEAGGQVADIGSFKDNAQSLTVAEVRGAYYPVAGLIAHRITAKETLRVGDRVGLVADGERREHIKRNHTGTHLLHAALRNILGTHVKQAGSLVAPDHLRFDFSHFAAVDSDELREIEQQVNEQILHNAEMQTDVTSIDDALASGALAFFGDKYPEQNVRVVTIPDPAAPRGFYSKELCGGTHVRRSGDIGVFKITGEQSVAAGVRRVEAITGARALADYQRALGTLRQLAGALNTGEEGLVAAVERLTANAKQLERQTEALKRKAAYGKLDELFEQARMVKDVRVVAAQVEGVDREAMRQLVDSLRQKLGSGVVVLGTAEDGKVALISGVTKDLTAKVHAGKLVQELAKQVGGSGGGRPDLAEAGGKDTSALKSALEGVYSLVERML